jgi:L-2-hydroxyglutarate oxidase
MPSVDVAVIGGGIVGLAVARAVSAERGDLRVAVLEKEHAVGTHQSGRNSGVIHSGIYYRPGSLKARLAVAGRRSMVAFCRDHGIAHEVCGKVVVATDGEERERMMSLYARGRENGVTVRLIDRAELRELEPHAEGIAALHVEETGIADYGHVCRTLAAGLDVRTATTVSAIVDREASAAVVVQTDRGDVEARCAVNCGGLWSDRLAADAADLRIVPFRGEYHELVADRRHLVRNMIYPVPDPAFPFLGVHFTRGTDNGVHAGPNAVLAFAREGYTWSDVDRRELAELARFAGMRKLAARHWRTGLGEVVRSVSRTALVRALQRLVPEVRADDLVPAPAGVRAQAVDRRGNLLDDFVLRDSARVVDVLNAPSPAATASLEIGRVVAGRVLAKVDAR